MSLQHSNIFADDKRSVLRLRTAEYLERTLDASFDHLQAAHLSPITRHFNNVNSDNPIFEDDTKSLASTSDALSESSDDSIENPFLDQAEVTLREEIAGLQEELSDVRERLTHAKAQLALEQSRLSVEYDDQYFEDQLGQLRSDIRHWCCEYFTHTGGYLTIYADRRFRVLTHNWPAYLNDTRWRPWLIQARIWATLQRCVFDEDSKKRSHYLFAGPAKKYAVDELLARASRDASHAGRVAYREWRVSTFALLFPGKGEDIDPAEYMKDVINDRIVQLRNKIWKSLRAYICPLASLDKKDMKVVLTDLLRKAIYLELDMKKHTAETSISLPDIRSRLLVDSDCMEEIEHQSDKGLVELAVSPALFKETDSLDGGRERRILQRAQVCSNPVRMFPPTGVKKVINVYTREIQDRTEAYQPSDASHTSLDTRSTPDLAWSCSQVEQHNFRLRDIRNYQPTRLMCLRN